MSTVAKPARRRASTRRLPAVLDRRFEAVVFDWDGTAATDRSADARELRALAEELCQRGLDLVVITVWVPRIRASLLGTRLVSGEV